jgi:hypothetical protein
VAGSCEHGDGPSGSGATELVNTLCMRSLFLSWLVRTCFTNRLTYFLAESVTCVYSMLQIKSYRSGYVVVVSESIHVFLQPCLGTLFGPRETTYRSRLKGMKLDSTVIPILTRLCLSCIKLPFSFTSFCSKVARNSVWMKGKCAS